MKTHETSSPIVAPPPPLSAPKADGTTLMQRAVASCVYLFERLMPDPFVIVILLTVLTALAAFGFAPKATPEVILSGWYKGIFGIFTFAFQMVLVLVTGYALADAPVIKAGLLRVSRLAVGPCSAVVLVFTVGAIATFLNWGFGLVVGAMLSKQVARQVHVDFAWLVAAGYSSWVLWAFTGMSSSIALSIASPGNPLNIVEQHTHVAVPLAHTVFSSWNLLTGLAAMILIPAIFILMRPAAKDIIAAKADALAAEEAVESAEPARQRDSLADRLDRSRLCALVFVVAGVAYLRHAMGSPWRQPRHQHCDLHFPACRVVPARKPEALRDGGRASGESDGSHAAAVSVLRRHHGDHGGYGARGGCRRRLHSRRFATTLPFLSYLASGLITLFIPSGGGHWAVQGPFTIPAAMNLGASMSGTSMAIAAGEMAGSLLQPFWAIPVVAIAGVGVQRVLGFTLVIFLTAGSFLGFVYLLIVPAFAGV